MISDNGKRQIQRHFEGNRAPVAIQIVTTADDRSDTIREFGQAMESLGLGIICKEIRSEDPVDPSIELAPNIHYTGVPSGNELPPFLRMLTASSEAPPPLSQELSVAIETVSIPAKMELFVMPLCHHCPKWVDALFPLAWANSNIDLRIIDAQTHYQRAKADDVKSVPTLIIDNLFRSTGMIDPKEIVTFLQSRKPSSLGSSALETMLNSGKAAQLAQLMAAEGIVFPAFLELLAHTKWPVRLGAMVSLEELANLNIELAATAIEHLWRQFEKVSDQVKGDILYLIGEIGGPETEVLLADIDRDRSSSEVCEAADDALQALRERFSG